MINIVFGESGIFNSHCSGFDAHGGSGVTIAFFDPSTLFDTRSFSNPFIVGIHERTQVVISYNVFRDIMAYAGNSCSVHVFYVKGFAVCGL